MKDVYLISCTKSKRKGICTAREMYMPSELYRSALNYALERVRDPDNQIYILSSKYGLLRLSQEIETYEETLTGKSPVFIADWGKRAVDILCRYHDLESTNFIILAGRAYTDPLLPYLKHTNEPLAGMPMGKRISWLQSQYERPKFPRILVDASELRDPSQLNQVSDDQPGWYRWWAPIASVERLLDSPWISEKCMTKLLPYLTAGKGRLEGYYAIYVGVAVNEPIRSRLDWHVNQKHTLSAIRSGTLSTFRQSISSLVSADQADEINTNEFLDTLKIEYQVLPHPIKSEEAATAIKRI